MSNKSINCQNDTKLAQKKPHVSKLGKYVIFSIVVVVLYTITDMFVFAQNGVEPEVLTRCVYGFFAGEVVVSGLIKLFNITLIERNNKKPYEDEYEDEEVHE